MAYTKEEKKDICISVNIELQPLFWYFVIFVYATYNHNHYINILSFCVRHIQSYFALKICTSNYQDNIYMPKIILLHVYYIIFIWALDYS
jgi:capsule polysaccharide export protein KpsE/RkpR